MWSASRVSKLSLFRGRLGTQYFVRHYGAEIIKVEAPGVGDPLRVWRELDVDGVSPWWRSIARNKKSVTIDLRKEAGRK